MTKTRFIKIAAAFAIVVTLGLLVRTTAEYKALSCTFVERTSAMEIENIKGEFTCISEAIADRPQAIQLFSARLSKLLDRAQAIASKQLDDAAAQARDHGVTAEKVAAADMRLRTASERVLELLGQIEDFQDRVAVRQAIEYYVYRAGETAQPKIEGDLTAMLPAVKELKEAVNHPTLTALHLLRNNRGLPLEAHLHDMQSMVDRYGPLLVQARRSGLALQHIVRLNELAERANDLFAKGRLGDLQR